MRFQLPRTLQFKDDNVNCVNSVNSLRCSYAVEKHVNYLRTVSIKFACGNLHVKLYGKTYEWHIIMNIIWRPWNDCWFAIPEVASTVQCSAAYGGRSYIQRQSALTGLAREYRLALVFRSAVCRPVTATSFLRPALTRAANHTGRTFSSTGAKDEL